MDKNAVIALLECDFENPGSLKSGEYLERLLHQRVRKLINIDRAILVEVLSDWLEECSEPRTMLCVKLAKDFNIPELKPLIAILRQKISYGIVLQRFYLKDIDDVMFSLNGGTDG